MYVEKIEVKNFRNYDAMTLALDQGTNIFYGNNAQGKTNILEAVYLVVLQNPTEEAAIRI